MVKNVSDSEECVRCYIANTCLIIYEASQNYLSIRFKFKLEDCSVTGFEDSVNLNPNG